MTLKPLVLHRVDERDFDEKIESHGGKRIDSPKEHATQSSADYIFDGAIIELKIVQEEGLEKPERQEKTGHLFSEQFPDRPVVVLDPGLLTTERQRRYYRI